MLIKDKFALFRRLLSWGGMSSATPAQSNQPGNELADTPAIHALEQRAESLLRAGKAEDACSIFRQLQARQVASGLIVRVFRDAVMDTVRSQSGEPYVAALSNVEVDTGYWVVLDQEKAYVKETYGRNFSKSPLVQYRATPDQSKFLAAYWPSGIHVEEPCILVGSDENYSHWLLRSLLKIWLIERDSHLSHLPWLVGEPLTSFQKEFLDILGFSARRLIEVPRHVVVNCRQLYVPVQMRGNKHFRSTVAWLHEKLQHLMSGTNDAQDRLFVSRNDAAHRFLVNEDELISALSTLGFQRIVPGSMTVREQIEIFSRAKIIVAPHGAALTNIIFSPPGLHVIEISSSNIYHMADFRWIAQEMKHRITTIISEDYAMDEQQKAAVAEMHWDYRVSIAEVLKAVGG